MPLKKNAFVYACLELKYGQIHISVERLISSKF